MDQTSPIEYRVHYMYIEKEATESDHLQCFFRNMVREGGGWG